jgi:hypothetical protein
MSNSLKAIDYGRDYNYFNKLSVNLPIDGYFSDDCQILIPFTTSTVTFQLESGGPLEYSMNGLTVHGNMTDGYASENLTFINRVMCKVWFRGVGTVRIEAWGIR